MSDEKKEEGTLELFKEAAKDLNEQFKDWSEAMHIPFLSTFFTFAGLAIAKWEKAKFEEFLDEIRIPFAFDNIGQMGVHIAQNIHHRWMADGLAQGWRLGLETMDDEARKCAYIMVAMYLAQKKVPDRAHRQLGRFFQEADGTVLRETLRVADAIFEMQRDSGGLEKAVVSPLTDLGTVRILRYDLLGFPVPPERSTPGAMVKRLWEKKDEALLQDLCSAYVRCGLLTPAGGENMVRPDDTSRAVTNAWGRATQYQLELWGQLRNYLSPVRASPAEPPGDQ